MKRKRKEKRTTTDTIPNMCHEKKLVDAFRQEVKEKKLLYATLMNEISRERYRKEPTNNEDN